MTDGTFEKMLAESDELGVVALCYDFDHKTEEFKYMIGVRKPSSSLDGTKTVSFNDQTFASFKSA